MEMGQSLDWIVISYTSLMALANCLTKDSFLHETAISLHRLSHSLSDDKNLYYEYRLYHWLHLHSNDVYFSL